MTVYASGPIHFLHFSLCLFGEAKQASFIQRIAVKSGRLVFHRQENHLECSNPSNYASEGLFPVNNEFRHVRMLPSLPLPWEP